MLGADDTAAASADTSLLYAGEQYDSALSQYYLRARYYNPSNGLFNRMDPLAGNNRDPQSLHKYLYCHANPVNAIDPSGQFIATIGSLISTLWVQAKTLYMRMHSAVTTWRYYSRAKTFIKAFAVISVISSALFSAYTEGNYPQGSITIDLPFSDRQILKGWPNVKLAYKMSGGDKIFSIKTSRGQGEDPSTIPGTTGPGGEGHLDLNINLSNPASSTWDLQASQSKSFYDKYPIEASVDVSAGFSGEFNLNVPIPSITIGIGMSFKSLWKPLSFGVGLDLIKYDGSGIEILWGIPLWEDEPLSQHE